MSELRSVVKDGKVLRPGYTTGSCAAGAAGAAVTLLLTGCAPAAARVTTPAGITLALEVLEPVRGAAFARCAIKKDGGDDPDATHGLLIFATAEKAEHGVQIRGGEGIGRVTKPGLDQPVGEAAINSVPRKMITECALTACGKAGYTGGVRITISAPGGVEAAKRTFNSRMGIEGGISIVGTSGIVEPMSNRALADTVRLELRQLAAEGVRDALITPGNYGADFSERALGLSLSAHVSCSNFIGDALDAAAENGFKRVLLVGHIGKLVKLGIGVTNTHSAFGDGRMETLAACALKAGADLAVLNAVLDCVTTDAALSALYGAGLLDKTMELLGGRIGGCLSRKVPEGMEAGFVCFTNREPFSGVLMESDNAEKLMDIWRYKR